MSWHPSDEDLILHFYRETPPAEAARVTRHLETCLACRDTWAELGETLKLVDAAPVPEPDAGFERVMWARIGQALPPPPAPLWSWRWLVPAVGLATAVVALLVVPAGAPSRAIPEASALPVATLASDEGRLLRERVLLTALDAHFERAELLLVELMNRPDAQESEIEFERVAADDLVSSGRLYRMTAEDTGEVGLVRVLEDLESVFVDVARAPDRVEREVMESLRARISEDGLLFKVRAVNADIRERQNTLSTVSAVNEELP